MKRILFIAAICFLLIRMNVNAQKNADSLFVKELTELVHKRIEAFDLGDTSIWSPYVADEYFIATPTGKVITKADVMKGFGPPTKGYRDVFHFEDVRVVKEPAMAVMSYIIKEHEWWGQQENDVPDLRKTDTYVLRNGRWLLLASQETFYPIKRKATTVSPAVLDNYVGQYEVMPSLHYTITREGQKLMVRENSSPDKSELLPLSNTLFFFQPDTGFFNEGGVGNVEFFVNKKGVVTHLVFSRYVADIKAKNVK